MSNNKNNNTSGELGSWIAVIACMIFFWPLGLFMLLRKLQSYAKEANKKRTEYTFTAEQTAEVNTDSSEKKKRYRRSGASSKRSSELMPLILLLIAIALVIFGANNVYQAARDITIYGADRYNLWDLMVGAFYCAGGVISFTVRGIWQRRSRRFNKFRALVGKRKVVPIAEIATAAGVSHKSARKALQSMIDDGYFGDSAYLDVGLDSLVRSAEAAEAARKAAKPPEPERTAHTENPYMAIIQELRELNITIIDEPISNKIDHIEYVTAQIFRTVEENPSKLPQIRRFMSYYLPTTLKLLHSYATLEKQGVQGENISGAKQNIGRILDTLSKGFEQQLDMLFKSDVIDISSDISVLENMMKQDGLTGGGMTMQMSDS